MDMDDLRSEVDAVIRSAHGRRGRNLICSSLVIRAQTTCLSQNNGRAGKREFRQSGERV
jgi:hypothetical protein